MTLATPVTLAPYISYGSEAIFVAAAFLFTGFSAALFYHIWYYSQNRKRGLVAFLCYLGGGIFILLSMSITLLTLP
jgi:hypothetical protein